jgi:hypothetical protein
MNQSSLKSNLCPVPLEQQPIYEYEQLKDSWFFSWATLNTFDYGKKILWLVFWGGLFASPISWASFPPSKEPILFAVFVGVGSILLTGLITIQFYLGWRYIGDRLEEEQILYEESGWYDGQIWQKPEDIIQRDRLIVTQKVQPILKRLRQTFWTLIIILGLETIIVVLSRL